VTSESRVDVSDYIDVDIAAMDQEAAQGGGGQNTHFHKNILSTASDVERYAEFSGYNIDRDMAFDTITESFGHVCISWHHSQSTRFDREYTSSYSKFTSNY